MPVLFCFLGVSLAVLAEDRPVAFLTFCGTVYRSGSFAAAFFHVDRRGQEVVWAGGVDVYIESDFQVAGERRTFFAGPDGKPVSDTVAFRRNVTLPRDSFPIGMVRHPVQGEADSCAVAWHVYVIPAGTQVSSPALLDSLSITAARPTSHALLGKHLRSYMQAGMVRMFKTRPGIRVFARVHDEGTRFSFFAGDDGAARFVDISGPKLILLSGLGCDIKAWARSFEHVACSGRTRENDFHILAYPDLVRQYAAVGFFDYPSFGAVDGPTIGGALARDLAGARKTDRIDMIGHSMGGMVARSYIEQYNGHETVDHAVLLQTPLNGVTNSIHRNFMSLSPLLGTETLNGVLCAVSPLAQLLQKSDFVRALNAPWEKSEAPASATGFGQCAYFSIATGIHGSGSDPGSAVGWIDYQSDALPHEIRAESALYLPLGDGRLGDLDQTGRREVLLISPSKETDRYIRHESFVAYMADDERNGACKWILSRLWPDALRRTGKGAQ